MCLIPYIYPIRPHQRIHSPLGYETYSSFKPWLRDEFCFRCVFCLDRERFYPNGDSAFGVEHLLPKSEDTELECEYTNLVYACSTCNSYKSTDRQLPDPCAVSLGTHLHVKEDGTVESLTPEGRRIERLLLLNENDRIEWRQLISRLIARGEKAWYLGYPSELPDLVALRPPQGNTLPDGALDCYYERRRRAELPETYLYFE